MPPQRGVLTFGRPRQVLIRPDLRKHNSHNSVTASRPHTYAGHADSDHIPATNCIWPRCMRRERTGLSCMLHQIVRTVVILTISCISFAHSHSRMLLQALASAKSAALLAPHKPVRQHV